MYKNFFLLFLATFALFSSASAEVNDVKKPEIHVNDFDEPVLYRAISDNGKWAVAEVRPDYNGGKVINLDDMSFVTITCLNEFGDYGRPLDVSDDGNIVVGTYGQEFYEQPAVWHRETGEWELLKFDYSRFGGGHVVAVTPDGKWGVGRLMGKVNMFTECYALWDLTTGEVVETPNLPEPQLDTFNQIHNRFNAISPDGRYICASVSPGGNVLYDRVEKCTIRPEGTLPDGRVARLNVAGMSPGCRYIFGPASINGSSAYDEDTDSWTNYCVYDMSDGSVSLLRSADVEGLMIWGIADDGTLYAGCGGNGTPMRDFMVYANGYWYALDQILYQAYGIDYYQYTRLGNTGTPYAFSADGRTIASFTDPNRGEGWVMKFNEPFSEIVQRVDLLGAYEISPKSGAEISHLSQIRIGFDRNITVDGHYSDIQLMDSEGSAVANAISASSENNIITIIFRPRALIEGENYTIEIPENFFCMTASPSVRNRKMQIIYHGRKNEPVAPADAALAQEYTLRCIDYSTSTLNIPFKSDIRLVQDAYASILRAEDGVKVADLMLAVTGNNLVVRSAAQIPLYRFSDYKVVIPDGVVTDLGAVPASANKAFEITVHGNWEDEPADDTVLVSEDFNNGLGNKFMFWEGDHLAPASQMAGWGFTADTTPWWVVRDSYETDDYAACSHSMYNGAGKANDWMVLRRLYIPDEKCRLLFDSQCYLPDRDDRLKVFVIPSDIIYNAVTEQAMTDFLQNRILVYDEIQDSGKNSETMAGEWRHNDLSLADFAGKYIYIAFVNENEEASALFVDNVKVQHDIAMSLSLLSAPAVVADTEYQVKVKLYMNSEALEFSNVTLTLLDSEDTPVSEYTTPDGTVFNHENPIEVAFPNLLSLSVGQVNNFSVAVSAGEVSTRFDRSVASLLFQTTKRAVLEEFSGSSCGNCPDGIIVMEQLKRDLGALFIPLSIRSYMGDELSPVNSDYAELLNLPALGAPSGVVNRRYGGYPIGRDDAGGILAIAGNLESGLWTDFVASEITQLANADMDAVCSVSDDKGRVDIDVNLKFAVDCENAQYSLFGVLSENQVRTTQDNYRWQVTDPFFGEWGAGGIYGKSQVRPYYCDDVVRNVSNRNLVGQLGLLPSEISAGSSFSEQLSVAVPARNVNLDNCFVTVMLIDNATGYVENALQVPVIPTSDVRNPCETDISIEKLGNVLHVSAYHNIVVELYDIAGSIISRASGSNVELSIPSGVSMLRISTPTRTITKKILNH